MWLGMNRSFLRSFVVMVSIILVGLVSDTRAGSGSIATTLDRIEEVRQLDVAQKEDDGSFVMNVPRLELRFDITPPEGKVIAHVEQPAKIVSVDSTGHDLTTVKPRFSTTVTYVDLIATWNEPPKAFTLKLLPAARAATHFSLDTTFKIWAYDKLDEIAIAPGTGGTPLDSALVGLDNVTVRLDKARQGAQLIFVPGTVRQRIESVKLMDGSTELDSLGSMWNDVMTSYMFKGDFKPTLKARIKVRVGFEAFPCHIQLNNQPLP